MISFKKINLNRPYYFFSDVKNVDPNFLSINKISHKNTEFAGYNIKYIMMESINKQNIDSENPLCLIFSDADAYITEETGKKYLIFVLTKKNEEVFRIYRKLRNKIKRQIKTINGGESIKYKIDFKKIRPDSSDDDLPLGKI